MKDIFHKLNHYEIRIRKTVDARLQGNFNSVFKGTGLEFNDIRSYQYGDDVRAIDWNVTAKGHGVFVKTFREEKEQTVFFMLDVSSSLSVGLEAQKKVELGKEIAGVLAISAIKEGSQAVLFCFSDIREKYIKPKKGMNYAYLIIQSLFKQVSQSAGTNINQALFFALNILKRKSVVILISDFIDDKPYDKSLKALSRRHDLIILHLVDKVEHTFPKIGIIPITDKEQGKTVWLNTSSGVFAKHLKDNFIANQQKIESFCRQNQVNYLAINTNEDYVPQLVRLFKIRNRGMKTNK
jgi:uncharacterized protein (DUF58 family)